MIQEKLTIGVIGSLEYMPLGNGLERLGEELYNTSFYIRAFNDVGDSDRAVGLIMQGYIEAYKKSKLADGPDEGVFATYPNSKNTHTLSNIESFFRLNNGNEINGVILFGGNVGLEIAARYIYINKIPAVALTCFGGAAQQIAEKHFDPYRRGNVITGIGKLEGIGKSLKDKINPVKKIEQSKQNGK